MLALCEGVLLPTVLFYWSGGKKLLYSRCFNAETSHIAPYSGTEILDYNTENLGCAAGLLM